jgi:hypothetical protein
MSSHWPSNQIPSCVSCALSSGAVKDRHPTVLMPEQRHRLLARRRAFTVVVCDRIPVLTRLSRAIPPQFVVLAVLARRGPITRLALAHELGVTPQAVTYHLDRLDRFLGSAGVPKARPALVRSSTGSLLITEHGRAALAGYVDDLLALRVIEPARYDELAVLFGEGPFAELSRAADATVHAPRHPNDGAPHGNAQNKRALAAH